MPIVDHSAFTIYRGQRKYDDELPLNKNTLNFGSQRQIDDPAPYIVVVQGPRHVGKSLLIESLVTRNLIDSLELAHIIPSRQKKIGSCTIRVPNKGIRLQFVECPNDINSMIDAAKYADVAILMVDASYGFEMETFEFRNLLQVHGFPKVIGVLTHLDKVSLAEKSRVKQRLEDHFCTEIYEGAKLFSLSGLVGCRYKMPEIRDLGEMLSYSQFLPLSWRAEHPYVLVDSFVDFTPERVHGDKQFNRHLHMFGYLRGCNIKKEAKVHIAGAGDFSARVKGAYDPCTDGSVRYFGPLDEESKGNYIMLDVLDVPLDIVEKFDDDHPILVGGILPEEENSGYMQVKLKRHSWRMDLLMTGAPITVSAGWRRYQTTAIYAMQNENGQHQLLNYTPEHKKCLAVFWGPLAPPKTKIAVLDSSNCQKDKEAFRIMAKGVILDFNHEAQILLKVENLGTVFGPGGKTKTVHIEFAPELDALKFSGAPIQSKSGVRGLIVGGVMRQKATGGWIAECSFEDYVHIGADTFFFPVLAAHVLPTLFKQLNLVSIDGSVEANIAAVNVATAAVIAATILRATNLVTAVEDELAVSYGEVAPRWRKLDLRRGVIIHEGKPSFVTCPNPLESIYSSVEQKKRIKKRKHRVHEAGEISGEVKEKHIPDRPRKEAMVIDDDKEVLSDNRAVELFLQTYGGKTVLSR